MNLLRKYTEKVKKNIHSRCYFHFVGEPFSQSTFLFTFSTRNQEGSMPAVTTVVDPKARVSGTHCPVLVLKETTLHSTCESLRNPITTATSKCSYLTAPLKRLRDF